jgi:hypothetical protein
MWGIYLENSYSYKVRRFENKRIQQIDRKLKEYYTNDMKNTTGQSQTAGDKSVHRDGYRTVDLSHLDRSNSIRPARHDNFFLLKDLNRLVNEPSVSVNAVANQNTGESLSGEIITRQQREFNSNFQTDNRFKVEKINDLV